MAPRVEAARRAWAALVAQAQPPSRPGTEACWDRVFDRVHEMRQRADVAAGDGDKARARRIRVRASHLERACWWMEALSEPQVAS